MPGLTSFGALDARSYGFTQLPKGYFISEFALTSQTSDAWVSVTPFGEPLVALTDGFYNQAFAKLSADGKNILQQGRVVNTVSANQPRMVGATDGSIYLGCYQSGGGQGSLLKISNANAKVWGRKLTIATTTAGAGPVIPAVAPSGNVYGILGPEGYGTETTAYVVKYNSAGTIQWQRRFSGSSTYVAAHSIAVTPTSEDVFIVAFSSSGTGVPTGCLVKYNSAGTIQWRKTFGSVYPGCMAIDSNENVFVLGRNGNDLRVYKFDNTGALLWGRALTAATGSDQAINYQIATDKNGAVYFCGTYNNGGANVVAKYTASGDLAWQLSIARNSVYTVTKAIAVDSEGDALVVAGIGSNGSPLTPLTLIKLPLNGSLTGTYSVGAASWVISTSSYTSSTSTPTITTLTATDNAGSATDANETLAYAATTYTQTQRAIP